MASFMSVLKQTLDGSLGTSNSQLDLCCFFLNVVCLKYID